MEDERHLLDILRKRHELLKAIRAFFYREGYIEVETASIMNTAPPDPYIEPLKVYIGDKGPFYLHTSPEINMKRLLSIGAERIFQICKVYREEVIEDTHSTEFTMLEWYRPGTYLDAMEEVELLIKSLIRQLGVGEEGWLMRPFKVFELEGLFLEHVGLNPFALDRDSLFNALQGKGFKGIDERDTWNSLFFKVFIQEIEDIILMEGPCFIKDWPDSISSMAKKKDAKKVERFELYIRGLEIANGYTELLDPEEQYQRFKGDNDERRALNGKAFQIDMDFLKSLKGIKGSFAGVALGLDRLIMALLDRKRIADVIVNRFTF